MKTRKKKTGKHTLTVIKQWLTLEDWRAALALIITVGGLLILALSVIHKHDVAVVQVSALIMLVLQWYFNGREKNE